jgi:hypothetical protein
MYLAGVKVGLYHIMITLIQLVGLFAMCTALYLTWELFRREAEDERYPVDPNLPK